MGAGIIYQVPCMCLSKLSLFPPVPQPCLTENILRHPWAVYSSSRKTGQFRLGAPNIVFVFFTLNAQLSYSHTNEKISSLSLHISQNVD